MEKAAWRQPDNFQAMNYVGYTPGRGRIRDLDRALKLLQKADELSPNQAYIIDSLAWALFRAGQAEKREKIRRAVSLSDNTDAAIWGALRRYCQPPGAQRKKRARRIKTIALKPDNVQALKQRLSQL